MADSAEHQFISKQFDATLRRISNSQLFGISEAQRRTFDYACILYRDFSRPLVSQVLWRHEEGIEKDLRTLLHDKEALLKVYFVADTVRGRARIDEVLSCYRTDKNLQQYLRGLRLILLPTEFDADREVDRHWMGHFLESCTMRDILFGVLFGGLSSYNFGVFLQHGGPIGLKYAILDDVTENGMFHMPTFKKRLGYKVSGPIREVLTMLVASGLVRQVDDSNCCVPTIKGRLLIDLTKLMLHEASSGEKWSAEVELLLNYLGFTELPPCTIPQVNEYKVINNTLSLNLLSACASSQFGRELVPKETKDNEEIFYSVYDWKKFVNPFDFELVNYSKWLADEEFLLYVDKVSEKE
ncbi:MAG: hypothetical protein AAFQ91_18830 [Cyanobacteria bacterium J06621_15]